MFLVRRGLQLWRLKKGHKIMGEFYKNDGCDIAVIERIEAEIGKPFPVSYKDFLCQSNGGEGTSEIRERSYIYLWRCEDITQYNKDYCVQKYLPENIVAFGMEGDYGYFLDYREPGEPKIISCSFGDLDIAEVQPEADTFEEFIKDWL